MASLNNASFAGWRDTLLADFAVADLADVDEVVVKAAIPDLTDLQAAAAVKFCTTLNQYIIKVQADINSGDIPPYSEGVV